MSRREGRRDLGAQVPTGGSRGAGTSTGSVERAWRDRVNLGFPAVSAPRRGFDDLRGISNNEMKCLVLFTLTSRFSPVQIP